jgi:hypothetical protein
MISSLRLRIFGGLATLAAAMPLAPARADITVLNQVDSNGYHFVNFDGPKPNTAGTTINGISNTGVVVGFTTPDNANFNNFTANPLTSTNSTAVNVNNSTTAMANGINSAGTIVGSDGKNNAFIQSGNSGVSFIPNGGVSATAFGINDNGAVSGQYTTLADTTPGFLLSNNVLTTINAPSGPNVVNAQGVNNNGLVAGFYLGIDGQVHGFTFDSKTAVNNVGVGKAIADPTIPTVAGEPGATFLFSQMLGINDKGIVSGYYGDSTTSQHGYLYDTNTGKYTFLDDPNAAFTANGVEVTQFTGINNLGEISGFYTDAAGLAHGFVATPLAAVPEPGSLALVGVGLCLAGVTMYVRRRFAAPVVK